MVSAEFRSRREQAVDAMTPGVLSVFAAPLAIRNDDVEHEHQEDSAVFYLTIPDGRACAR